MVDEVGFVVLDVGVEVLFRLQVDLFGVLLVLEPQLVEVLRRPVRGGATLDTALGLVGWQGVGRHVVRVVDAARDDGSIRIAFEELDDDLLTDAGDVNAAPVGAAPNLTDTHPTARVLVGLAVAVPVELELHPAVLVGPDFLPGLAYDPGGLRAVDDRLGRGRAGSVRDLAGD